MQAVAAQVLARREHKYRQLEVMVDYAETNACRRRSILQHFGDTRFRRRAVMLRQLPVANRGRRNAAHQSDLSQSERAALIVLDTLKHLKWPIGRTKLAQLLKGSSAKDMQRFEYDQARNYGKFATLKKYEIEALIDQLIESGHVKQVGSERPTLKLTPRGETALHMKSAIRVELRHITPSATRRVKARERSRRDSGADRTIAGARPDTRADCRRTRPDRRHDLFASGAVDRPRASSTSTRLCQVTCSGKFAQRS